MKFSTALAGASLVGSALATLPAIESKVLPAGSVPSRPSS